MKKKKNIAHSYTHMSTSICQYLNPFFFAYSIHTYRTFYDFIAFHSCSIPPEKLKSLYICDSHFFCHFLHSHSFSMPIVWFEFYLFVLCRFACLGLFIRYSSVYVFTQKESDKKTTTKKRNGMNPFYKDYLVALLCLLGRCKFVHTLARDYIKIEPFLKVIQCE